MKKKTQRTRKGLVVKTNVKAGAAAAASLFPFGFGE